VPKGHDSAHIRLDSGDVITLDYSYHRYEERHGNGAAESFLDWDIKAFYLNGEHIEKAAVAALLPDYDDRFSRLIQDAH
jgi:hypothetical protein